MTKWIFTLALLLTVGAGIAMADIPVVFDPTQCADAFGDAPGSGSPDITFSNNPNGCTLGNVTFLYDPAGDPSATAQVTNHGIDGFGNGLNGLLEFIFSTPIYGGLRFDFSLGTATGPLAAADGALVLLDNGVSQTFGTDSTGFGTVYIPTPDAPYTQVTTLFTADQTATNFNISDMTYDTPEPGAYILLGTGLLFLGCARLKGLRRTR